MFFHMVEKMYQMNTTQCYYSDNFSLYGFSSSMMYTAKVFILILEIVIVEVKFQHIGGYLLSIELQNYSKWDSWGPCSMGCLQHRLKRCTAQSRRCLYQTIRESRNCDKTSDCQKVRANLSVETLDFFSKPCGMKQRLRHKILGGNAAAEGDWPWLVTLGYRSYSTKISVCGATLIASQWVITAAHCINSYMVHPIRNGITHAIMQSDLVFVRVGSYSKGRHDRGQFLAAVSHITVHPLYRHSSTYTDYDIALIRLRSPISSDNTNLGYACISADKHFELPLDSVCYVSGWGEQYTKTQKFGTFDPRLQEVRIPLVSYSECKQHYTNIILNYTHQICGGEFMKDACQGDSGGGLYCRHPMTKKWMLYGIVSFGTNAGCGNVFGVYARISVILDWIRGIATRPYQPL